MTYTIEGAKLWAAERRAELDARRVACADETVKMLNQVMPDKSREVWDSGVWLARMLDGLGATDEQVKAAQFACGQRAFGGDAWAAVVAAANEFAANGAIDEKPGAELLEKVHREVFGDGEAADRRGE